MKVVISRRANNEAVTTPYLGNYKKIAEWLPRIGDVKIAQIQFCQYSSRYDAFLNGEIMPVFDPQRSGGALMDLNFYNIYFTMGLFGNSQKAKYYANIVRGIDTSGMIVMEYAGFLVNCTAAKDCKGIKGSIIQGTNGYITCSDSANLVGEVTLNLNDGTVERFDDGSSRARVIPEFMEFMRAMEEEDFAFCYRMLDQSLEVSRLQTQLRHEAGIIFPVDDK